MKNLITLIFLLLFIICTKDSLSQPGKIDSTFGLNGIVTNPIKVIGNSTIASTALQDDGKIVAAGSMGIGCEYYFALARYNNDGNLDYTFGTGGIVITEIGNIAMASSVVIQSDGKIVVGGTSSDGFSNDFTLVRYNTDGSLDRTFGSSGIVVTNSTGSSESLLSLAIQPDGKIIAAGYSNYFGTSDFALARYGTTGDLDEEFGIDGVGILPSPGNERINSIAIQNDGKIIAAGYSDYYGTKDFVLVRCDEYGNLDGDFGTGGILVTELSKEQEIYKIEIQDDGKIIAAGNSFDESSDESVFILARYETNGDLDSDFGSGDIGIDGIVVTEIGSTAAATSIVVQSDGKIVAAGCSFSGTDKDFTLTRYNIDGILDADFGTGGILTLPETSSEDMALSVLIEDNGNIITAGYSDDGIRRFSLVCCNINGEEVNSFGDNGRVITPVGKADAKAYSMVIQGDGKIIVAGTAFNGTDYDAALARYNTDGELDTTFGTKGIVIKGGSGNDYIYSAALQTNGSGEEKIIVGGCSDEYGTKDFVIARFNNDGSLDTTFGSGGALITPIGSADDEIYSIAVQENGKIIAAGYTDNGSDNDFAIARYTPAGEPDISFGGDGFITTKIGTKDECANSVAIESAGMADGRIIAVGHVFNGTYPDFALVCYNSNGELDNNFETDGILTTQIGAVSDYAYSVVIQSDGKIIAAGSTDSEIDEDPSFVLVRYHSNGIIDSSYGKYGIVTTQIRAASKIKSVSIQSNGKIIAAGSCYQHGKVDFALARYNTDGELDNTFGTGGFVTTSISGAESYNDIFASVIQKDGKIVIAGYSADDYGSQNYSVFSLIRYNGDPVTDVKEEKLNLLPASFVLEQNYPNPFNPTTILSFTISQESFVSLKVYDILGREVAILVEEEKPAGEYKIEFSGTNLPSGIYFYQLKAGNYTETKKMVLMR